MGLKFRGPEYAKVDAEENGAASELEQQQKLPFRAAAAAEDPTCSDCGSDDPQRQLLQVRQLRECERV